jgi:hypothetical protein
MSQRSLTRDIKRLSRLPERFEGIAAENQFRT